MQSWSTLLYQNGDRENTTTNHEDDDHNVYQIVRIIMFLGKVTI